MPLFGALSFLGLLLAEPIELLLVLLFQRGMDGSDVGRLRG